MVTTLMDFLSSMVLFYMLCSYCVYEIVSDFYQKNLLKIYQKNLLLLTFTKKIVQATMSSL